MPRNSDWDLPATWPAAYPRHGPVSALEARSLDLAAENRFGIPSLLLMEHASRGVAEIAAALTRPEERIIVCCGPGNNGGDGYGAARFLRSWGRPAQVLKMSRDFPGSDDAAFEVRLLSDTGPIDDAWSAPETLQRALERGAGFLVDALFGVGLDRPLGTPYVTWVEQINASGIPALSVDIPSGMHTDTGEPLPLCVRAAVTATMAAPKVGFAADEPGESAAGHVIEVDIGLPRPLLHHLELEGD